MKKIAIAILMIFTLFITGCSKYKTYTEINYSELQSKLDNKDTFVLVVGSSTCSACANYKTTMEKVIKDKQVEIFYIDMKLLSEEDYAKLYSKFVVVSTPTTIFIKDGIETSTYDRIVGSANYSDVVNNLKKQGYIGD